jgi:exopolysaccharide biosynthesis polyprenyl glycosylphosphotransferase
MAQKLLFKTSLAQAGRRALPMQLGEHRNILLTVDGAIVLFSLFLGLYLGAQRSGWLFSLGLIFSYIPWFLGLTALYYLLATVNNAYQPKLMADFVNSAVAVIKTVLQIFALYLLLYALLPPWSLPRHFIGFFAVIAPLLLLGWRRVYSWAFTIPMFQHKAIIVGAGWTGTTIAKTIRDFAPSYFQVLGFVDDDAARWAQSIEGWPVLGGSADLPKLVQAKGATDVVLAINRDISGQVLSSLMTCYERNIRVSTMAELYEGLTARLPVEHIGDNWFVMLPSNKGQNLTYRCLKRGFDILVSALGLALFFPLLPLLAVVIASDSQGPIFYKQRRVGRGGQVFELIKLRSMVVNAESDGVARWAGKGDARVTRVGRLLRQTRLDEAPQLFNILRGEMSLVGPRPERPEFMAQLQAEIPFYRTRLTVKPGLTGWAQVNYDYGRNTVDALEKLRYDLYYIKHQSLHLDLMILIKTVGTILSLRGV